MFTQTENEFLNSMKTYENNAEYEMTDTEALLSPARIRGFAFSEKLWAFFLVEKIVDFEWSGSAFEELELEHSTKSTILSLVRNHYNCTPERSLLLRKGKGLVMLLYGPTGTGKTSTAGKQDTNGAVHLHLR